MVRKALAHLETAQELLGADHPALGTVRLNACNFAIRLCPEPERAAVLEEAAAVARALESTADPISHMQRAFYFQLTGNDEAAVREWRKAVERSGGGLFATWYAAAAFGLNRSAEGRSVLDRLKPSTDGLLAVARACLLLDLDLPEEAETIYRDVAARVGLSRVMAETIPLLAGDAERVAANSILLLEAVPAQHPDRPTLCYLAGKCSPEELVESAGVSRRQRCQAHYFIALRLLAQSDRESARRQFNLCLETGTHWLPQFQWGRAFRARLDADPRWPHWIRV
jgi:hypothetical protein